MTQYAIIKKLTGPEKAEVEVLPEEIPAAETTEQTRELPALPESALRGGEDS